MIDQGGNDTELARLLHSEGKIGVEMLRTCLIETRVNRPHAGATLARMLVHKGVLSEPEAHLFLVNLKKKDSQLSSSLAQSGPQVALTPPQPIIPSAQPVRERGISSSHDGMTVAGRAWSAPLGEGANDTVVGSAARPSAEGAQSWKAGMKVGDFRLVDQLGAGGMGIVYTAEHILTKELYALKTLQDESDPELVERLKREAEALATVGKHPNVVGVHSLGQAFGRVYIVMELVKGGDLLQKIRKGPLPIDEAVRIAREIANGLVFLHGKGVLHRDLKPGNVLFDEKGTPKLVDFGLALTDRADRLTRTGEILGTPNFMAPEQALLERDRIGPWTDIYGVAGLLYYMLTGSSPFEGSSLIEVMTRVARDPVKPPRSRRKEIPAELDALIVRGLAKEPEQRPTGADFVAALDAIARPRGKTGRTVAPSSTVVAAEAAPPPIPWLRVALAGGAAFVLVMAGAMAGALIALKVAIPHGAVNGDRAAVTPPVAPVTTAAPVPAPPPAAVAPKAPARPSLGWRFNVGEVGTLTTVNRWTIRGMGFDYTRTLELGYRVLTADPRAELECTVNRLAVVLAARRRDDLPAGTPALDYDSRRGADHRQPFQRAIGKKFTIMIDPLTGTIGQTSGATPIYDAVLEAAREAQRDRDERPRPGDDRRTEIFRLGEFQSDLALREHFETLLHLLPEGGEVPGWRWSIPRLLGKDLRAALPNVQLAIETPVVVTQNDAKGTVELRWEGEASEGRAKRTVSGSAEFGPRGLRRSKQHEKIDTGERGSFDLDVELVDAGR